MYEDAILKKNEPDIAQETLNIVTTILTKNLLIMVSESRKYSMIKKAYSYFQK